MNFSTMEYFVILAEERNFTKAAERLHITQQSLSSHIANLENDLGCQLVVRRSPLQLTFAGEMMLQYAESFHKEYTDMVHEFHDISQRQFGILHVGTSATRARTILPDVICSFQQLFPNICVDLSEAPNSSLFKQLQEGKLDLVIAVFPKKIPGIALREYYQEEVVLLIQKEMFHSICGTDADKYMQCFKEGDFRGLSKCPFVLGGVDDIDGRIGRALFDRNGIKKPAVKAISHSMGPLLALCLQGVGACFCPENLARSSLTAEQFNSLLLFQIDKDAQYPVSFGYQINSYQWSIIEAFMTCAQSKTEKCL